MEDLEINPTKVNFNKKFKWYLQINDPEHSSSVVKGKQQCKIFYGKGVKIRGDAMVTIHYDAGSEMPATLTSWESELDSLVATAEYFCRFPMKSI